MVEPHDGERVAATRQRHVALRRLSNPLVVLYHRTLFGVVIDQRVARQLGRPGVLAIRGCHALGSLVHQPPRAGVALADNGPVGHAEQLSVNRALVKATVAEEARHLLLLDAERIGPDHHRLVVRSRARHVQQGHRAPGGLLGVVGV